MEVCIFDDGSTDGSIHIIKEWVTIFQQSNFYVIAIIKEEIKNCIGRGPGFARNRAIENSQGEYLCFVDSDDWILPQRIEIQYTAASQLPFNYLIGCQFTRDPPNSTIRYTTWCNSLNFTTLFSQRFRENTLALPT